MNPIRAVKKKELVTINHWARGNYCMVIRAALCARGGFLAPADAVGQSAEAVPPKPALHRWRRDVFLSRATGGRPLVDEICVHIPDAGLRVASWKPTASAQSFERCLQRLCRAIDVVCLQETHGRSVFSRAVSTISSQWHMVGTFVDGLVHAGGSAILVRKSPLQGGCVRENVVIHIGRDHLITLRAANRLLMIANVHLEPGSNLTHLRGRLHASHGHWPRYPDGVGILIGDFNTCEPEEGRCNAVTHVFAELQLFSTFPHALVTVTARFHDERCCS